MEYVIYNIRVGLLLTAFYLIYRLCLSRETFLRLNRIVLLVLLGLSFSIPKWRITIDAGPQGQTINERLSAFATTYTLDELVISGNNGTSIWGWFSFGNIATAIYLAGVVFFASRWLWSLIQVCRVLRLGDHIRIGQGVTLVLNDSDRAPFSWLRFVYMNRKDYTEHRDEILTHELAHIRYGHSVDLLAMDLACCIQWFNPSAWLMRQELSAVHEYEADKAVLDSGINAKQYQILLIKKAAGSKWSSIANSFNHSKLKSRITMMLRKKSSVWAKAKVLYALPIIGGAMIAFANIACSDEDTQNSVHNAWESTQAPTSITLNLDQLYKDEALKSMLTGGHISEVKMKNGVVDSIRTIYGEAFKVSNQHSNLICDVRPIFPGGDQALMKYLAETVRYPESAKERGVEGRVFVHFTIDETGKPVQVWPRSSTDSDLEAEAVRVVRSMPNWEPGKNDGQAVRTAFVVPIKFVLE